MTVLKGPVLLLLVVSMSMFTLGSCDEFKRTEKVKSESKTAVREIQEGTLASVNGVYISDFDVDPILKKNPNYRKNPERMKKVVLEMIIRQELMYQKALELGLDRSPDDYYDDYQEEIQRLEAQLNAFKRKIMSRRFRKQEITKKAIITEDEMKTYFGENLRKIQTEFHIGQILYRGNEKAINDDLNDIEKGASFEDVAEKRFSSLPKKLNMHPWDLGYLRWNQIPEAWQDVIYGMKKGETSGIIKGPKERFWIIKLVDRRENPNPDFEKSKSIIKAILKRKKIEELSNQWKKKLRDEAEVIYYKRAEKEKELPIEE